jgi:hypothetical protein
MADKSKTEKSVDERVAEAKAQVQGQQKAPKPVQPQTESDKLWEKMRQLPLDIFALPDQTVEMHCKRVPLDPNSVHLKLKSTAVLPALEQSLRAIKLPPDKTWKLENGTRFCIVSVETVY